MGVWEYIFGVSKKAEASKPETVPPKTEPVKPVKYGAKNRIRTLEEAAGIEQPETVPPPAKERTYRK